MRIECPHCQARVRLDDPPDDDTPVRCPECRKKFIPPDPDDEDDDRPRKGGKKGRKKAREEEKGFPVVPVAIGGGVVALLAVGGIMWAVTSGGGSKPNLKPGEVAAVNPPQAQTPPVTPPVQQPPATPPAGVQNNAGTNPAGNPPPPPPAKTNPPPRTGGPVVVRPPVNDLGPYAALFAQPLDVPPRTVKAASLRPTAADKVPEVPTFHSLLMARKGTSGTTAPKGAKLTLDEVKKACAYIKVDAGDLSGTGSGFLIATDGKTHGLVATNYHVVEAAAGPRYGTGTSTVTAVFNSGLADEKISRAQIVAYDPLADLAVLRVEGAGPWPKPISPYNAPPKVSEGIEVQFWGFPLGDILSSGKKNPEITLGKGSVSSLRHTAGGKLDRVQINGTMNPGNSGGPLVDADGRLVGTAVSIINPQIGTGIGFAVPVDDLIGLLEGRMLGTVFVPLELQAGKAKFLAFSPVMDPLERIDTIFVRRWAGAGTPPEVVRDPLTGYKPFAMRKDGKANLPGADEFRLEKFKTEGGSATGLGIAIGEVDVPLDAGQVLLQVASQTVPHPQTGAKLTAASKPVSYTLSVGDQAVGADARPFAELTSNPDSLAGKVVVVKGRVAAPPNTLGAVQELIVVGLDGRRPDRMRFLVDRASAAEFDEVVREHQPLPVRLVCLVGQRGPDGFLPVRVARLDFIGRGDRVVRTIPAKGDTPDDLAGLNRDPGKYAGKTLEMSVSAVPVTRRTVEANEFSVLFPGQQPPRNLAFVISPAMRQRLFEALGTGLRPGTIVPAKVTVVVPDKAFPPGVRAVVTVTKIVFVDEEGKPLRTIE